MARGKTSGRESGKAAVTPPVATVVGSIPDLSRPAPSEAVPQAGSFGEAVVLKSCLFTLAQALDALILARSVEVVKHPEPGSVLDFYGEVRRFETDLIRGALRISGGKLSQAAKLLKLKPSTLHQMMRRYEIDSAGE